MIEIKDKKECCGCEACVQRCPKSCISLQADEEGFLYPDVNASLCIDCGLCERVCPVLNPRKSEVPINVSAAVNPDERVRLESSSGGVFSLLAEKVIQRGGVVFGATFDKEWNVVHSYAETMAGIKAFRGSKYVQSHLGTTYQIAEKFLKDGRDVLFSGTPCQISGLKYFLRKDYPNLLTVDFICHGVPSPGIFKQYMAELTSRQMNRWHLSSSNSLFVNRIEFRNKKKGWKNFSFMVEYSISEDQSSSSSKIVLYSKTVNKDPFLRGFMKNLYLRPSCHACPTKNLTSGSDITIGDFWGAHKHIRKLDDNKGVSVLVANTQRGQNALKAAINNIYPITYQQLVQTNSAILYSTPLTAAHNAFFADATKSVIERIERLAPINYKLIAKRNLLRLLELLHIR